MQKIYWLLILVPITLGVRYLTSWNGTLIFLFSAGAMIPLAKLLSDATEQLSFRTGPTLGALLNVTFGNAGELVIGFFALQAGLQRLVKASITGSILVNLLLTLGISMLAGGLRKKTLKFNPLAARTQTTMLALAAISLILPAGFSLLGGTAARSGMGDLSLEFSVVLLVIYGLSLLFTLGTHEQLLVPPKTDETTSGEAAWSARRALMALIVSAVFVAWMGEVLVGSIEAASRSLGMTDLFVGLVVVAIAGNAAESTAAVRASLKNRMDLSVGIAAGAVFRSRCSLRPCWYFSASGWAQAQWTSCLRPSKSLPSFWL